MPHTCAGGWWSATRRHPFSYLTGAACADLRDHAVRLMKRCGRHGLRRCCGGQGNGSNSVTVEGIDALAALITCKSLIGLRASLSPYGDWQLMAVMVGRSHWRCARHALNWLQQKVEHAA